MWNLQQSFQESVGLVKHKKKMHQEVKVDMIVGTKVCLVCQVSLKRTELLKHMKDKHPDREIGFSCYICDKNFPCLAKLKRHIVIHEPRTENFNCDQCDFVTGPKENLERHRRRHYSYVECNIC